MFSSHQHLFYDRNVTLLGFILLRGAGTANLTSLKLLCRENPD
uniref:Uncharacterized protein n=1 Tax=Rhizophora mucronata TaxID=61149 RepID=A0A2P2NTZ7_RHIMU